MSHPIHDPGHVKLFALAGKAKLTVVSKKSGDRVTYKVRQSQDGHVHFVSVREDSSYTYMGMLKGGRDELTPTKNSKVRPDEKPFRAFDYVWGNLVRRDRLPDDVEVWHEGQCGRCGRALTVPESIARGIGPECWSKMGGAR